MTSEPHRQTFVVRWADLDANGHMKNTAYLDVCVDVRVGFFARHGFTPEDFRRHGVGPVVRRDEVDFYRELSFLEAYWVDLELAGASADGSRFRLQNRFFREDGTVAARVVSTGGWLDLEARRLVVAPEALWQALHQMRRAEGFEDLRSSVRPPSEVLG